MFASMVEFYAEIRYCVVAEVGGFNLIVCGMLGKPAGNDGITAILMYFHIGNKVAVASEAALGERVWVFGIGMGLGVPTT